MSDRMLSPVDLPPLPGSEFEWEDLLVRIEVMPRALSVTIESAGAVDSVVHEVLDDLVLREEEAARFLENLTAPEGADLRPPGGSARGSAEAKLARFARLRVRNFAMAQRRGIEVWEWSARLEGGERATVYQLFNYLARGDVEALARLRGSAGRAADC